MKNFEEFLKARDKAEKEISEIVEKLIDDYELGLGEIDIKVNADCTSVISPANYYGYFATKRVTHTTIKITI